MDNNHDPVTGEIIEHEPRGERAADGGIVPYTSGTAGEIIDVMEDGQFSVDVVREMEKLAQNMIELAVASGKMQKGKVVMTLDLSTDGAGPLLVKSSFKVTPPKEPRRPTVLFADEDNGYRLSRTQPRQRQMFGIRQVGGASPGVRTV